MTQIGQYCIINKQPRYAATSISAGRERQLSPVVFGENVYIGDRVTIYAGCEIGDNTYIADGASIRENVKIGKNCIVGRSVVIESDLVIGDGVKIQALSMVHVNLGNNVFIGPMFNTAADKGFTSGKLEFQTIEDDVMIGSGVILMPGVKIGRGARIGAGALVTKDVPAGETWIGNPARRMEKEVIWP
jgi:acetyltransferase-like isoleucine patch superfamily enzyme